MCKSYLPVLTLLLNLRPHLKNEFYLFHHPFTSAWQDEKITTPLEVIPGACNLRLNCTAAKRFESLSLQQPKHLPELLSYQ